MKKPLEFARFPKALSSLTKFGPYRAVILNVPDGDTVHVLVDVGWNDYPYRSIRLRDIKAEPDHTPKGAEATKYLSALLYIGRSCVVTTFKDTQVQTFGRYVGDVTLIDMEGTVFDLGTHLVGLGYAVRA